MWLCWGRIYTLEVGSIGVGDGWSQGMKEGTEMRMSLRILIQTSRLDPHFTEQMRPSGSPIISSLSFTLWITMHLFFSFFPLRKVAFLLHSYVTSPISNSELLFFFSMFLDLLFCCISFKFSSSGVFLSLYTKFKFYLLWSKNPDLLTCYLNPHLPLKASCFTKWSVFVMTVSQNRYY